MPFKKGFSRDVIGSNIKEMMSAGRPRNEAIASSLASARKYKKMSKGGEVNEFEEDDMGESEPNVPAYAKGGMVDNSKPDPEYRGRNMPRPAPQMESMAEMDRKDPEDYISSIEEERLEGTPHENEVENPVEQDEASMFAKALLKKRSAMVGPESAYAMGGLVEEDHLQDQGTMPSENMEDSTEEPMSSMPGRGQGAERHPVEQQPSGPGLSSQAKEAILRKKKNRMF